ncbi:MAG TPA: hypothetical protein VJ725_04730 [Thermoanaerobaculia bacterium]|nr:hypothetical protein [Thermoanaerobaculia bacterium]
MRRVSLSIVVCCLSLLSALPAAAAGGTGYFNTNVNWQYTGTLYYYVVGGPPNTCGELRSTRNGASLSAPGWLCTDAYGNATKGPWYWSSTPSNQTDTNLAIWWPDGTHTSYAWHIWDKTCPTPYLDSPLGFPPTTYYGHATDQTWGACFSSSWSNVISYFQDTTTGFYWDPATGDYTSPSAVAVSGTLTGMPGCSVNWTTTFPSPGVYKAGHRYNWRTGVTDGGCRTFSSAFF